MTSHQNHSLNHSPNWNTNTRRKTESATTEHGKITWETIRRVAVERLSNQGRNHVIPTTTRHFCENSAEMSTRGKFVTSYARGHHDRRQRLPPRNKSFTMGNQWIKQNARNLECLRYLKRSRNGDRARWHPWKRNVKKTLLCSGRSLSMSMLIRP